MSAKNNVYNVGLLANLKIIIDCFMYYKKARKAPCPLYYFNFKKPILKAL